MLTKEKLSRIKLDLECDIEVAHNAGLVAARKATETFLAKHGDADACGFAWVTVYEKGTTLFVRELKKHGFRKAHGGGYQLWNPSGSHTQCVTAKYVGAVAYAEVIQAAFPSVTILADDRLD
jgi:hypothetical protein